MSAVSWDTLFFARKVLAALLLRGAIVNRAYGTHKNLYVHLFSLTIFGPIYSWSPVVVFLVVRVVVLVVFVVDVGVAGISARGRWCIVRYCEQRCLYPFLSLPSLLFVYCWCCCFMLLMSALPVIKGVSLAVAAAAAAAAAVNTAVAIVFSAVLQPSFVFSLVSPLFSRTATVCVRGSQDLLPEV